MTDIIKMYKENSEYLELYGLSKVSALKLMENGVTLKKMSYEEYNIRYGEQYKAGDLWAYSLTDIDDLIDHFKEWEMTDVTFAVIETMDKETLLYETE